MAAPKDVPEKAWWEDKTIQVPKGLLIKGTSGEAVAVYAKMKGFGKEARSSLGALATRLGWSEQKARKYQNELWAAGWILLLREGENKEPRMWWMATAPGEQPPQELVTRVSKNGTLPPQIQGDVFDQGSENPPPGKTLPKAYKALQANKETPSKQDPPPKAASGKHQEQDAWWTEAKAIWTARYPGQVLWTWPGTEGSPAIRNFQASLTAHLQRLGRAALALRWKHCVNDAFTKPSLRVFFADTDRWIEARTTGAAAARPFHNPKPVDAFKPAPTLGEKGHP